MSESIITFLVQVLARFFFGLIVIFFPEGPTTIIPTLNETNFTTLSEDGYAYLTKRSFGVEPFRLPYWNALNGSTNSTYYFGHVSEVISFDSNYGAFVISQYGEIRVLRFGNANNNEDGYRVTQTFQVRMPPNIGQHGGILHAAFDSMTGRLFFTIAEKKGITSIYHTEDSMQTRIAQNKRQHQDELDITVFIKHPLSETRSFHGLAIDAKRRILFALEASVHGKADGSVMLWPLEAPLKNKPLLTQYLSKIESNSPFRPWSCSLHGDYLAVSDHASNSVHMLRLVADQAKAKSNQTTTSLQRLTITLLQGNSSGGNTMVPWGVHFDPVGNLLVADRSRHRIQLFQHEQSNNDQTIMSLKLAWQSEPVAKVHHLKSVATVATAINNFYNHGSSPSVRIVAAMFPSKLLIIK